MTDQQRIPKSRIQTAFRDADLRVPTDAEMDESQRFVDNIFSSKSSQPHCWVEDMLVPTGIELGALIEEEES